MKRSIGVVALGLLVVLVACGPAWAQAGGAAGAKAPGTVVLDTSGFWRMFHTIAMPVLRMDSVLKPAEPGGAEVGGWKTQLSQPTAPPPQGWTAPDFEDGGWFRGTGGAVCRTPYLERLCLRGRFQVTDQAQAKGLTLSLGFHGGAVVYLNGKEIARKFVPAGVAAIGEGNGRKEVRNAGNGWRMRWLAFACGKDENGMGRRQKDESVSGKWNGTSRRNRRNTLITNRLQTDSAMDS